MILIFLGDFYQNLLPLNCVFSFCIGYCYTIIPIPSSLRSLSQGSISNLYSTSSLLQNFFLNQKGEIITNNIYAEALEKMLVKVLE
ncbi:MAG: hypothetical protein KTR26_17020 [Flammeovirgaceae bacterium]|nr:hypothetical protein [Flammeovirgaceae bacterium]